MIIVVWTIIHRVNLQTKLITIINFLIYYSLYTSKKDDQMTHLSTGEKKIISVFCTSVVFGIFTLVDVSYNTANINKQLTALPDYLNGKL